MILVVVIFVVAWFVLLMHMSYKAVVRRWEISQDAIGINVRRRPQPVTLVGSDIVPEALALLARHHPNGRIGRDYFDADELVVDVKDWRYVRTMEMALFGRHFHTLDGQCFPAGVPYDHPDHEPSLVINPWPAVTAQDIKGMTMQEFAEFRRAWDNVTKTTANRGIFS